MQFWQSLDAPLWPLSANFVKPGHADGCAVQSNIGDALGIGGGFRLVCGAHLVAKSASRAMGFGIWSMHFIGMLAFEIPGLEMAYDIPLMTLSVVVAIGGSALALFIVSRQNVAISSLVAGGIAMAAAIAGMHYIGMY